LRKKEIVLQATSPHQHSPAVVAMHVGDDVVRPQCTASFSILRRSEAASDKEVLAAANAQQHTGMRHLTAPLQEHGAGWSWETLPLQNQTGTLTGKVFGLMDEPAVG
jgi:hypothetical protein